MRPFSLRFRLLMAWLLFIVLILGAAAIGLRLLFEQRIQLKEFADLSLDARRLARAVVVDDDGQVKLSDTPSDPLYQTVYSGRYWQINAGERVLFRSPSLWAARLELPAEAQVAPGTEGEVRLAGPDDQTLIGVSRPVQIGDAAHAMRIVIICAIDDAAIQKATRAFASDILISLALLAGLLFAAAAAHVSIGLKPLTELRRHLARVRDGSSRRLDGEFPREVMPLVKETNALLDAQDDALTITRTRASNLAHGLKTPLAVMATHSRQLRRRGDVELAEGIDRQIETMRRHVERELARTRERGTGSQRYQLIDAGRTIAEIISALKHLPKGQVLRWDVTIPRPLSLPVERADFIDIMGNLLDNGHKWASSRVVVDARASGTMAVLKVADDGPGVQQADLERILRRGERADTTTPGTGLGLAIVNDLVHLYGGRLSLSRAAIGGLEAVVELPCRS